MLIVNTIFVMFVNNRTRAGRRYINTSYATLSSGILNNYPAKSRGISPDT